MSLFKKKKEDDADSLEIQDTDTAGIPETQDNAHIQDPSNTQNPQNPQESDDSQEPQESLDLKDPVLRMAAEIRSAMESGEISEEIRTLLTHALNYQQDMDRAIADAELRGRNTAIEEHLDTMEQSDGVPHPGCGQGVPDASSHYSIFDLARGAR